MKESDKSTLQKIRDAKSFHDILKVYRIPKIHQHDRIVYYCHEMWNKFSNLLQLIFSFNLITHIAGFLSTLIPDFTPKSFETDNFDDLSDLLGEKRGDDKFLNAYTVEDISKIIRKSSINTKLQKLGFSDWYIKFDLSDTYSHYGYIRSPRFPDRNQYIGFIIVHNGPFHLSISQKQPWSDFIKTRFPQNANMLAIRWFSLQNPLGSFTPQKPKLPGQLFPGSGFARDALSIFCKLAIAHHRDGISNVPEHFHNAYLYKGFLFLHPLEQGRFEKMKEDLETDIRTKSIGAVSWAVYLGFLYEDEKQIRWTPTEQVYPLSPRMLFYFNSSDFKMMVELGKSTAGHFSIRWDEAEKYCMSSILSSSQFTGEKNISDS